MVLIDNRTEPATHRFTSGRLIEEEPPKKTNKMTGKEVIRAAQMFTKTGAASRISVVKELGIGLALGLVAGMVWQTYHWNENKKWEDL